MTKKHYELIAGVIAISRKVEGTGERSQAIYYVTQRLADEFQKENTRFNRAKFLEACGIKE